MEWHRLEIEYDDSFISNLVLWIELIFSICVSTALFSLIFLEAAEAIFFCALAMILCMIEPWWENLWESKGLSNRFPALDLIIYPVVRVLAIIVLFATVEVDSLVTILFVQFLVMSIYGRFVIRVVKRYRSERGHYERRKRRHLTQYCACLRICDTLISLVRLAKLRTHNSWFGRRAIAKGGK